MRPLASFPPSIWGDRFLSLSVDTHELNACAKTIKAPKEELRSLILSQNLDSNEKLCLFNYLYRLGLTYLFVEEIE
ncbi:germacrene A synthase, partial [Tanacetum coccineum]